MKDGLVRDLIALFSIIGVIFTILGVIVAIAALFKPDEFTVVIQNLLPEPNPIIEFEASSPTTETITKAPSTQSSPTPFSTSASEALSSKSPPTTTRIPTKAPRPTNTPRPTPTTIPTTEPGKVLKNGETWHTENWSLTVSNFTYRTLEDVDFTLFNRTGRTILLPGINTEKVKVISDIGDETHPCKIESFAQTEVASNNKLEWTWYFRTDTYCRVGRPGEKFSPEATTLTLVVEDIGGVISNARWQAEIPRP